MFENNQIELFLNPRNTSIVLFGKLRERLLVSDVLFPEEFSHERSPCLAYELLPAIKTTISLFPSKRSILFYMRRMTAGALFLYVIANVSLITAPVCHGMEFLALRFVN